jgi:hypothetical protein
VEHQVRSGFAEMAAEIERRCREIAEIEALLPAGHPDVQGLCLTLSDWSQELRLLEGIGAPGELGNANRSYF